MPRVTQHKKSRAGRQYICVICRAEIAPGETYYEWSFRYAGTHRQHTRHGMPRQSQLTTSKMAEVYAAAEALEDWSYPNPLTDDATAEDVETALQEMIRDAQSVLEEARSQAQDVADEYQQAIDDMPASEEQNQERIDAIEEWISELESAESELSSIDVDTSLLGEVDAQSAAELFDEACEAAQGYMQDAAGAFNY